MATADLNIPAEKLREIVREEIARQGRHDADMLRRCAEACRNAQKQMRGRTDWFDWVPAHLDRMADYLVAEPETDTRPHSRACGFRAHPHGSECHSSCPTCHGTTEKENH